MKRTIIKPIIVFILFLFSACKTYYIPVESFKAFPKGHVGRHLDFITCYDKKGNPKLIKNDGSVEIRITDNNNKRQGGYFETLIINDTIITFCRSFILSLDATFKLDNICLIEIQNVKKGLKYNREKQLFK
ncbi:MAG: hypothetical protein LBL90_13835 [Prevotellaceae bacterium]|jgi:hypothetical protein|nr:hypothetical protein [Prevotellaceae bacterium]